MGITGDVGKLTAEITLIRARAEHIRDLASQITDEQARQGLFAHADNIEQRAAELEARVVVLKAE